jgi:hypothetical protein
MKYIFPCLFSLAAVVLAVAPVGAARVKTWHHHKAGDHEKATLKGVVVSNTGALRLSRRLRPLAGLEATHVWALAEDRNGNLYAGTGDEGKVYRVTPDGKVSVAYAGEAAQVLSLATDGKGEVVYAGTGPTARVVRIDAHGAKVLCELKESYVWALAVGPKDEAVYAATGPHGKIYRVTADGKAQLFYDTKQDHVLCLAVAADGTVYAGTDKTGRVYRIDARGKAFVLFQAPQSEVRTLALADDALYAGTSATKRRSTSTARSSASTTTAQAATPKTETPAAVLSRAIAAVTGAAVGKAEPSKSKEATKGSKTAAPSEPAGGENSVWRIGLDGSVREVFRDKVLVLSLLRHRGKLTVGTGIAGQLFEVEESSREKSEIARLDHGQVLCQLRRKDGSVVLGAGDPGKLYVLEERHEQSGTVVSDVLDAKLVSRWGALRWRADLPANTSIAVAARSGNVAEPDETWSEWGTTQTDGAEATIDAPPARYLQYRVTLRTLDPAVSPALKSLTLRYATANQAPEVMKVEVPDLSAATLDNPKKLKLKWSATDANEDELRYRLLVKKDGWQRWIELEEDWDKTEYEWDATTTPSGVYRLKVVASDRVNNAEKDALTGAKVSEPFVVCHTPPKVHVSIAGSDGDRVTVEATASSPLVRLTAASFAINGKKWVNVFPADGLFDGRRESFQFKTEALKPGTYVIVLRVQDAAGNIGTGDVLFTVPLRPVVQK